jgi:hypothetical protein
MFAMSHCHSSLKPNVLLSLLFQHKCVTQLEGHYQALVKWAETHYLDLRSIDLGCCFIVVHS